MTGMQRKMGIIDPETGNIVFVSRDEGHKHLRKSAQRTAAQTQPDAIKVEISGKKAQGI